MRTTTCLSLAAGLAICAPAFAQVDLFSNGNLSTGATTVSGVAAPGVGNNWSEVPTQEFVPGIREANTSAGFLQSIGGAARIADDFTIPSGQTWNISAFRFASYQTGGTSASNTHNNINFRVWNGAPNAGTSTVIFGDTTTNRFASGTFGNLFRIFATGPNCAGLSSAPGTTRNIYINEATAGFTLGAGTYWVDWQVGGTLGSGPWSPSVVVDLNTRGKPGANALQFFSAAWNPITDTGIAGGTCPTPTVVPQDQAFVVRGTQGGPPACYANCDQSTVAPVLNVGDYVCFNTAFQAAQSLPPAQQVTAYANCDQSTVQPVLNVGDYVCFNTAFQAGCP